ncbi:MAG TPA: hypothetical protein VFA61_08330 [Candidatus Udaeobacter sp.]|nr:hypothetical protein [Candidatus Udaeobacter sp.]
MKSPLSRFFLKATPLFVSLSSLIGSLTVAHEGHNDPLVIGAVPRVPLNYSTDSAQGYLMVYSATEEFSDGDLAFNAHSSYSVYTPDGRLFKSVENHVSRSEEIPELVRLPVGSYTVEARSDRDGYLRVRVVIKTGVLTVLDLDGEQTDTHESKALLNVDSVR